MSHTPGILFEEVSQHQPGCSGCGAWKSSAYQLTQCNTELLAALTACEQIEVLRNELSECYARIHDAGRTTTAESTMTSKQRVEEIRAELKTIRQANQVAIAHAEGRG